MVLLKVSLHGKALLAATADVFSLCLQQLHCTSPDNCAYKKKKKNYKLHSFILSHMYACILDII